MRSQGLHPPRGARLFSFVPECQGPGAASLAHGALGLGLRKVLMLLGRAVLLDSLMGEEKSKTKVRAWWACLPATLPFLFLKT